MKVSKKDQSIADSLLNFKGYIVVSLPNNFDNDVIDTIESNILDELSRNKKTRGVLVGLETVTTTDPHDLSRLKDMMAAIALMGGRIGIFGINPGLAAVVIKSNLSLPIQAAGHDMEDLLKQLS